MGVANINTKHVTIAENVLKLYDEGIKQMWEDIFFGDRNANDMYVRTFYKARLSERIFKPPHTIAPSNASNLFRYAIAEGEPIDAVAFEEKYGFPMFDFSNCTQVDEAFRCNAFSRLGVIDLRKISGANYTYFLFAQTDWSENDRNLKSIEKIIVSETTPFYSTFFWCTELVHCIFEGTIAKNGLTFAQCYKLSYESLISVIDCLKDYSEDTSGTTWKVTFGTTNLNKLTAEDKQRIEVKGWTYA